jgi:hypothetical protein
LVFKLRPILLRARRFSAAFIKVRQNLSLDEEEFNSDASAVGVGAVGGGGLLVRLLLPVEDSITGAKGTLTGVGAGGVGGGGGGTSLLT